MTLIAEFVLKREIYNYTCIGLKVDSTEAELLITFYVIDNVAKFMLLLYFIMGVFYIMVLYVIVSIPCIHKSVFYLYTS